MKSWKEELLEDGFGNEELHTVFRFLEEGRATPDWGIALPMSFVQRAIQMSLLRTFHLSWTKSFSA